MERRSPLNVADVLIIVAYFVFILGLSVRISMKRRARGVVEELEERDGALSPESEEFFLAGRNTSWLGVGCSLFMSNIGSEHFVALASSGATSGLAVANFEWIATMYITLALGYLFVPFYIGTNIRTIPEFLSVRFCKAARLYIAMVTVFTGVVVKICVVLYSGSIVLEALLGWSSWLSLTALILATCIYTVVGGLEAVISTEIVQAFVLLLGGIPLAILSLRSVGGWEKLSTSLIAESTDRRWMLHLLQPLRGVDWVEFPWTGILFGLPAMEVYYWCTDQVVAQRVLAAKSVVHAKGGCVLTAFAKLLIPPIMVLPGMCARVLFQDVRTEPNRAFPTAVAELLPNGLLGLMVAAMLAALMSSLASTYNSTSAIISYDFYRQLHPRASERTLVLVGRLSIVVLTAIGILWIPIVSRISSGLYVYIQSIISYVAPPIAVVYTGGVFWRRATPAAAVVTLYLGGLLGLARLVAEIVLKSLEKHTSNAFLSFAVYSNFLHFALFSTCLSTAVLVLVSLCTHPAGQEQTDAVFAQASKASDLASYGVVPEFDGDSTSSGPSRMGEEDSGMATAGTGTEQTMDRLHFRAPAVSSARWLGNEGQKVVVNLLASVHLAFAGSIFWHFR
mmetsp:Transcript_6679/g.20237  ORF Transcript_6679/g.20237 Transcript_6679/m.20237 type:complete len:621 (+) Transcript_6679:326-2188(+)